jgi:NADPH2:quinone reductase
MKAVWYERLGEAAEVLRYGEHPTPQAGAGEVRVRLHASGVNPADCNRRAGRGHPMEFPRVITHSDGAGVVDQVGEGVDAALLGRRVWLYNGQRGRAFGTAAQWIALDATLVTPLPDALGFDEGACLGIPAMTAWLCTFMDGEVSGRTVLVQGGAGAVGHVAVQLAKWGGARVIATVSGEAKRRHALAAGADAVIDRRDEDVAARVLALTEGAGVDRIVEVDFGGNLEVSMEVLRPNGRIAAYASRGDASPRLPFTEMMRRNLSVHGVLLPGTPVAARRAAQQGLMRWVAAGGAQLAVSAVFGLADTVRAHQAVEAGTKLGTVVVRCD